MFALPAQWPLATLIPADATQPRRTVLRKPGQDKLSGEEIAALLRTDLTEVIENLDGKLIGKGAINGRATAEAGDVLMPGDVIRGDVLISI
jgi:hypothetical protein